MLSTELWLGNTSVVRTYSKVPLLQRLPSQLGRSKPTRSSLAKHSRSPTQGGSSLVCKSQQVAPDEEFDWAARYEGTLRTVPLAAGALGIVGVLVNRLVSGIEPVVDASSAQSRADVLVIGLSAVLVLTGLQWLSLKPKPLVAVEPDAEYVSYIDSQLPEEAKAELQWLWRALRFATRCRGVVAFHKGRCIMHCGMAAPGTVPGSATVGPIGIAAMKSGSGNYLANLILFPGRVEFTEYFPENAQGVLVQPIGEDGLLVCGTDTQRGFGRLDQAWIAAITEKLDIALRETEECLEGVKVE